MNFSVLICEDTRQHRKFFEDIVKKHLMSEDFDMSLALSTDSPSKLLAYLKEHPKTQGIYLLDVHLQSEINGIELAAEIKNIDKSATIVLITTHSEMVHFAFKLKVEAMDYILKDSPPEVIERRIVECIDVAYNRLLDGTRAAVKHFVVKIGNRKLRVPFDEILYFESGHAQRNKICLHKPNGTLDFYGTINDISSLGLPFLNCHQSFVVNMNYIKSVDSNLREIVMSNGVVIPIAKRKVTEIMKHM